jgi:hypothetical protein
VLRGELGGEAWRQVHPSRLPRLAKRSSVSPGAVWITQGMAGLWMTTAVSLLKGSCHFPRDLPLGKWHVTH